MDWKFKVALCACFYGVYLLLNLTAAKAAVCGADWETVNQVADDVILSINSVTHGNGQFVAAVGFPGGFLTSPDGLNWTRRTLLGTQVYEGITWGGGQYVAVGKMRTLSAGIQTSPDGVNWSASDPGTTNQFYDVTWNGNTYVAVGGTNDVLTLSISSDGDTWTPIFGSGGTLRSVTWSGSQFVAVGWGKLTGYTYDIAPILTSQDGVDWTFHNSGTYQRLYDVTWGKNKFVAVGSGSQDFNIKAIILTSQDGINWTGRDSGTTRDLRSVTWSDNQFVVVGVDGTVLTSQDGITWTTQNSETNQDLFGVTWGNDKIVAVGSSDTILISSCISDGPDMPNLTPYKPSNWSDKIVISKVKATNTDNSNLLSNDILYLDYAIENNGTAVVSSPFYTTLYINGTEKESWSTESLDLTHYSNVKDYYLGTLPSGTHQIKIVTDSKDDIEESNEDDNFYTKSITITPPPTQPTYVTGQAIVDFVGHQNLSVANATVEIEGTELITQTDNNGNFSFDASDLNPGDYNLIISSFGLDTYIHSINIADGHSIDLESVKMSVETVGCTEEELDQAADAERIKWDAKGDGLIGIEEAIHALQVVAGHQ